MQKIVSGCQAEANKGSCENLHTSAMQPYRLQNHACKADVLQLLCAAADTLHPTIVAQQIS
jgi:hypothetical protein